MPMFTALIAGICGYIIDLQGEPYVTIGHINGNECVSPIMTIASGVTAKSVPGFRHVTRVEINDDEAIVTIDGKRFRIPRTI
jgi:hypothetical protein